MIISTTETEQNEMTFYEICIFENGRVVDGNTKKTHEEALRWVRDLPANKHYTITKSTMTFGLVT